MTPQSVEISNICARHLPICKNSVKSVRVEFMLWMFSRNFPGCAVYCGKHSVENREIQAAMQNFRQINLDLSSLAKS